MVEVVVLAEIEVVLVVVAVVVEEVVVVVVEAIWLSKVKEI